MSGYRFGKYEAPADLTMAEVEDELAKLIVTQMVRQGLTEVVAPSGARYDVAVHIDLRLLSPT